ncbi:MAG: hypothetical protein ACRDGI_02400 [Candidatus Limnocylindrales bacterium]
MNLAARIAAQAAAGEILVAGVVAARLDVAGIPLVGVRQGSFKGIAAPIELLQIAIDAH